MIINSIGDPTGFAESLRLLHEKMPSGQLWCVGDLVDRGPSSKEVMDFFINGGHKSVMGNHDHMMLFEKMKKEPGTHPMLYQAGAWMYNGGDATLKSFNPESPYSFDADSPELEPYFNFIKEMPLIKQIDNLIITHAPIPNRMRDRKSFDLSEINKNPWAINQTALWNRFPPTKLKDKFQVYGHNSTRGILWHTDKNPQGIYMKNPFEIPEGAWGACIDTWSQGYLTGISIDTDLLANPQEAIKIFQQDVVEKTEYISDLVRQMRIELLKGVT